MFYQACPPPSMRTRNQFTRCFLLQGPTIFGGALARVQKLKMKQAKTLPMFPPTAAPTSFSSQPYVGCGWSYKRDFSFQAEVRADCLEASKERDCRGASRHRGSSPMCFWCTKRPEDPGWLSIKNS